MWLQYVGLLFVLCTSKVHSAEPPNIVIIIADDLGIGDVGCFGNDTIRTPNIDSIARQGARLSHHLAAESVCTPSRAALLTGRYPVRTGMASGITAPIIFFAGSSAGLPQSETTIAEIAKQKGYSTALIGKWHLGINCRWLGDNCHHPLSHGFDYFYGLPLTLMRNFINPDLAVYKQTNKYVVEKYLLTVGVGLLFAVLLAMTNNFTKLNAFCILFLYLIIPSYMLFPFTNNLTLNSILMRNYDVVEQPIRLQANMTKRLVNEGVNFMEQQTTQGRPFLLVMSWLQVHSPLHTGPEFAGVSRHQRYGDNVEEMDWSTGEIMRALERLGVKNNTLVYFTSDNGPHIEDRGEDGQPEGGTTGIYKGGKFQSGTEGGIRMPSAMMWPHHIPENLEISAPTSQMDIFPTIRKLLDLPEDKDIVIDGKDIMPLVRGDTKISPHQMMWHYCSQSLHAARYIPEEGDDIWKVYYVTNDYLPGTTMCNWFCRCYEDVIVHDPPILYNIAKDPSEDHPIDVTSDQKYRRILSIIENARLEHVNSLEPVTVQLDRAGFVWLPYLQPCCNFPSCTCVDQKSKLELLERYGASKPV